MSEPSRLLAGFSGSGCWVIVGTAPPNKLPNKSDGLPPADAGCVDVPISALIRLPIFARVSYWPSSESAAFCSPAA
jgi:hypothetical protein